VVEKMYRVCFYKNFHLEQFLPYRSSGILISQKKDTVWITAGDFRNWCH